MQSYINELKEKGLVPLRLDRNTVILVPPEKANEKYKARYLKNAERARRMATHLDYFESSRVAYVRGFVRRRMCGNSRCHIVW